MIKFVSLSYFTLLRLPKINRKNSFNCKLTVEIRVLKVKHPCLKVTPVGHPIF